MRYEIRHLAPRPEGNLATATIRLCVLKSGDSRGTVMPEKPLQARLFRRAWTLSAGRATCGLHASARPHRLRPGLRALLRSTLRPSSAVRPSSSSLHPGFFFGDSDPPHGYAVSEMFRVIFIASSAIGMHARDLIREAVRSRPEVHSGHAKVIDNAVVGYIK